jgi:hypothetical protein
MFFVVDLLMIDLSRIVTSCGHYSREKHTVTSLSPPPRKGKYKRKWGNIKKEERESKKWKSKKLKKAFETQKCIRDGIGTI